MKELDDAITSLTKLKPFVDEFKGLETKIATARQELSVMQKSLETLRKTVTDERNARAAESNRAKKEHEDTIHGRTGALADLDTAVHDARNELTQVQNDIAKYQKALDALTKQYNREVKAVA